MTLQQTILEIGVTTMGNLISNLAWLIMLFWGFKTISKEIREGVKNVPQWIDKYHKKQMERIRVQEALDRREK